MRKVFKYIIPTNTDYPVINLPVISEVLYVREQYNQICLWAIVDTNHLQPTTPYKLRIAGTGHDIEDSGLLYLGSAHLGGGSLIIHVFNIS